MPLYADAAVLAVTAEWKTRLQACVAETASEIGKAVLAMPERGAPEKQRFRLARQVLIDLETWSEIFAWAIAVQNGITLGSDDAAIKLQVSGLWDVLAEVPI